MLAELRVDCERAGFDLVKPLQVGWYNSEVSGSLRLEDFGSPAHLAVVVGNTRALWPKFLAALRAEPKLLDEQNPLQRYTELSLNRAVSSSGARASIRFGHEGGERTVALQRLAQIAGLAYLSASYMSVHPEFGPWIGLRAAISFELAGPPTRELPLSHPCGSCEAGCLPAFERALEVTRDPRQASSVRANWQLWLACRDACPTGREHRYDLEQIRYHYLADRTELVTAIGPTSPQRR